MDHSPLVSISIITYNHSAYIRQALDGVFMQKTTFDFEVIVGDDLSTDNTREILQEYQARYPDKLRLILHETKPPGIPGKINFVSTIHAAEGKYVALLDGDDYWTEPDKLQKQVDFLESQPEYSICFHNALLTFEGFEEGKYASRPYNQGKTPAKFQIQDLILNDWFMHSGSIMYRREWFPRVPDSFYEMQSGDIPLGIILASRGPVHYLPEVMSVYRKNPGSVSATLGAHIAAGALLSRINIFSQLNEDLDSQYQPVFDKAIARFYLRLAIQYLKSKEYPELKMALGKAREYRAWYGPKEKAYLLMLTLITRLPFGAGLIRGLISLRARLK